MRIRLLLAIALSGILASHASADDIELLQEEARDAAARERAEMEDRIRDLEAQHQASQAIADKQQELIEALQLQIQALQENENDRSSREE